MQSRRNAPAIAGRDFLQSLPVRNAGKTACCVAVAAGGCRIPATARCCASRCQIAVADDAFFRVKAGLRADKQHRSSGSQPGRHPGDGPGQAAPFLRRRKSSLIDGVGDDACDLSAHLAAYLRDRVLSSPELIAARG